MGNCVFKGTCELMNSNNDNNNRSLSSSSEKSGTIKVVTANGGVMELFPPITAECITSEFPNHAIFTTQHPHPLEDDPLLHTDQLCLGHSYFLLPIPIPIPIPINSYKPPTTQRDQGQQLCATPYRMSLDTHKPQHHHQKKKRWSSSDGSGGLEMSMSSSWTTPRFSRNSCNNGVWKVKLVISPEQLSEILAQEATTEELVESLRTVAKCGNAGSIASGSDKWSISSTAPNQFNDCNSIYGSSV